MIIVEGPDLIGKTTLCKELVKRLNKHGRPHIYKHFSRLPSSLWRGDYPCELYWSHAARHSVQDRFHMSEPLYAQIRDEQPILSPAQYRLLDCRLRAEHGMVTILLYDPDGSTIKRRWREGEMYGIDDVLRVNTYYHEIAMDQEQTWGDYRLSYDCKIAAPALESGKAAPLLDVLMNRYIDVQFTLDHAGWRR